MSVLDPRELQASPLADLHALAAELGLESFRRLRKEELIKQIVVAQGGEMPAASDDDDGADEPETALYEDAAAEREGPLAVDEDEPEADVEPEADGEPEPDADGEPEADGDD